MVTSYTASYNPEYMEDPKTFKPKRWNRESSELNAFVSLPFGFGTRSCYGMYWKLVVCCIDLCTGAAVQ